MTNIAIFDSTLRDGAQGEGVSFSVEDKLNIMVALDTQGITYIEAGNPFSNPKDAEFFKRVKITPPKNAKLVAFGSTRHRNIKTEEDLNCTALMEAGTEFISIFGKSSDWQARNILGVDLEENINMIHDTVNFFTNHGKHVFYDAEHFFDGYKSNPQYAIETLRAALDSGAFRVVLCDTNGGCFPHEITNITTEIEKLFPGKLSIHCHDDSGCAVANSVAAVRAGAAEVQGTYVGFGERCGNANLSTIIADLQLKLGYSCIPDSCMEKLTSTAYLISEISNIRLPRSMPYVGKSAFAHKGGMHVDGISKNSAAFEHVPPASIGNQRHILLSEVSGRTAMMGKIQQFVPDLTKNSPEAICLMERLKEKEFAGFQYEAATASFELLVLRELGRFTPFFEPIMFRILGEQETTHHTSTAIVKLRVGNEYEITAEEGDGPVHALDRALRKALEVFYPRLAGVRLVDYKVRVMDSMATAALVRVLIESTDGENVWTTVGVSQDIINASLQALVDSMEYKLYTDHIRHEKYKKI